MKEQPPSRIVYSTPKFEGDRTNPSFTYVGADPIEPKQEVKKGGKKKKVFYSSGTVFWDQRQVESVLSLVDKYNIYLYLTRGLLLPNMKVPDNVEVFDFTDDKQILTEMDVMISQGGLGTVTNGIRAGVPMIVTPLFFANQPQAKRVERYGNGKAVLGIDNQVQHLGEALEEILDDPSYQQKASQLREEFAQLGGSKQAANIIEQKI